MYHEKNWALDSGGLFSTLPFPRDSVILTFNEASERTDPPACNSNKSLAKFTLTVVGGSGMFRPVVIYNLFNLPMA